MFKYSITELSNYKMQPLLSRLSVTAVTCILLLIGVGCDADDGASSTSSAKTPAAAASVPDTSVPSLPDSVLAPPDSATGARFEAAMQYARDRNLHDQPVGRIMQELGQTFARAPYLEGTLDEPDEETLVVRLDGFDCVTFVETTLAMARGVAVQDYSYDGFAQRLAQMRYRGGVVGYCSRLHYFSDWMRDNDRKALVRDLTPVLGGRALRDTIDFMSTHRNAYVRFATNDSLYRCVQQAEAELRRSTAREPLRYVPQDSIRAVYNELTAGDVIAIVTSIDGLDVAHTGLAFVPASGAPSDTTGAARQAGDDVGLLHASLSGGVVVSPDLQRYVQQIEHMIGIVVARPRPVSPSS